MTRLVAVVGATATGKSALAIALARSLGGEVLSCDSTAVYRGIDIGTDKVPVAARGGVPHHLIDLVEPTDVYSAARYARDAAAVARAVVARGHLPVLVGGTGFYYRALVRGIFPGPARDEALRRRLGRVADRRGVEALHRWLRRVDPASAIRIQPRDRKRLVRALEVYRLTGRPLTDHFGDTRSPIADFSVLTVGLRLPRPDLEPRVARRVEQQFEAGVVDEVRGLLARGVPASAHAFSGLVYRQVIELLQGVRNEADTRELIVRENMRYSRRQAIWFRREPGVHWLESAGGVGGGGERRAGARPAMAGGAARRPGDHGVDFASRAGGRMVVMGAGPVRPAASRGSCSSSWTRSASASCRTRRRTATRAATRSDMSRGRRRWRSPHSGRWGWDGSSTSVGPTASRVAPTAGWPRPRPGRTR